MLKQNKLIQGLMTTPSKIMLNGRKSVLFIEFFIGNDYICSYKYKYDEKKEAI